MRNDTVYGDGGSARGARYTFRRYGLLFNPDHNMLRCIAWSKHRALQYQYVIRSGLDPFVRRGMEAHVHCYTQQAKRYFVLGVTTTWDMGKGADRRINLGKKL